MSYLILKRAVLGLALLSVAGQAGADLTLVLKKSFIKKYEDRVTLGAPCFVDKAHKKANAPSKDGDLHIAVRCEGVDLSAVAEIMNANQRKDVIDLVHGAEGTGETVQISGAWRLWPEHGGTDELHSQLKPPLAPFTTTNPDHLFEIHPVSEFAGSAVGETFEEIVGYKPKDASAAFFHYESKRMKIQPKGGVVEMSFPGVGYNYVKFMMRLTASPEKESDGYSALASIHDLDGHLLVRKRRTLFVESTPPARAIADKKEGDCLYVLGIPRISLKLVNWRVENFNKPEWKARDVLNWGLPYEMIIAAVYPEQCGAEE